MRIKKTFILREIAGEFVLVPVGETAQELNGIVTVNETGAFLWKLLQTEQTEASLLSAMLDEYEIDEPQAKADISDFLEMLRKNDLI